MFGCIFGALCLVGLIAMLRRHHHGPWGGRCGGGRWGRGPGGGWDDGPGMGGGPWGGGRGGFVRSQILRQVSMRLRATPGQERVIAEAVDEVLQAGRSAHEAMRAGKKDIAEVFSGPAFDESLLGDVFSRQDDAIRNVRLAATGALARVHEVLEPEQRERLAELLARGPGRWAY